MRIALLIYDSLETVSGGYLYDRMLVQHLRSHGDQVGIISLPWRRYPDHLTDNFSSVVSQQVKDLRPDICIQDELVHPSLFWQNQRLKNSLGCMQVSLVHHLRSSEPHPWVLNMLYRAVERRYLNSVDGFIYNSQATQKTVEELLSAPRPCVTAYPCGDRFRTEISPQQVRQRSHEAGSLRLLFAGSVTPRKGLHILLAALSLIGRKMDWRLTVAGSLTTDLRYSERTRQAAAAGDLAGRVDFAGVLDDEQMADQMAASHVLVLPSLYEGFGIVYLEGMGFGLPAIATLAGGAPEIIHDGENGFLVPPGDAGLLAKRITQLGRSRDLLESMSLSARMRFLSHPTWDVSMAQVRDFLYSLRS